VFVEEQHHAPTWASYWLNPRRQSVALPPCHQQSTAERWVNSLLLLAPCSSRYFYSSQPTSDRLPSIH
jgi:hypothetical protein